MSANWTRLNASYERPSQLWSVRYPQAAALSKRGIAAQ